MQKRDKLGVCGSNTCEPVFQGCEVAAWNVPGGVNEGVCGPMSGLDDERAVPAVRPGALLQNFTNMTGSSRITFP